jgi:putative tricarboxylic transport membrane protein
MLMSQGDLSIFWSNSLVGTIFGLGVILLFWPVFSWVQIKARRFKAA